MSQSLAAAGRPQPLGAAAASETAYQPGVCNIGPAEIAARRRSGHVGVIASVVLFAILVAIGAPPLARLLIAIPAAIGASGYLQARAKFCAGFGSRGVFNFGDLGTTEHVEDAAARALDRRRSTQLGLSAFAIGIAVAIVAVLLPV
jgi:hypothetical protein